MSNYTAPNRQDFSLIAAVIAVSESEIALLYPEYSADKPLAEIKPYLWELGLDTNQAFEVQPVMQHRNRLKKVVTCARYFGHERTDPEYIASGMASREAIDKSKNSRFLDEIYRSKGMTMDVQAAMEIKDRYNKEKEDV